MNAQPFAELICAYLDGVPGACDVLNDALEEAGRARVVVDGTTGERLALVLEQLLIESLARRVAVDFARHVMGICDSPLAQAVMDQKSAQVDPAASDEDIQRATARLSELGDEHTRPQQGYLYELGWGDENTPQTSAAWALWGALRIPVRFVASAAQRAVTTELQWQIEHLKQLLLEGCHT